MLLYFASNFGAKIQLIINKVKEIIKNFRNLRNAGGGETANRSRLSETGKRVHSISAYDQEKKRQYCFIYKSTLLV